MSRAASTREASLVRIDRWPASQRLSVDLPTPEISESLRMVISLAASSRRTASAIWSECTYVLWVEGACQLSHVCRYGAIRRQRAQFRRRSSLSPPGGGVRRADETRTIYRCVSARTKCRGCCPRTRNRPRIAGAALASGTHDGRKYCHAPVATHGGRRRQRPPRAPLQAALTRLPVISCRPWTTGSHT